MLGSQSFGVALWVGGDQLQLTAKSMAASVFKWTPCLKYYAVLVCHFALQFPSQQGFVSILSLPLRNESTLHMIVIRTAYCNAVDDSMQ